MFKYAVPLFSAAVTVVLTGCAGSPLRSYDSELKEIVVQVKAGAIPQAIEGLERNNASMFASKDKDGKAIADDTDKDILYFLEKGELLNLQSKYRDGRDTWLKADEVVRTWEDEYRTNATKLFGDIGSYLVSDRVRRYDGQDYEKVALSTRLTLNHIMLGDFDNARVEMKKTVERETLIKSFREKEYDKLKEEGDKNQVKADTKQLGEKGYPMAELDTPDVRQLKNGFQNAFSHYLAGYFFDVTGEPSMAEPGYRNALELQPDSKQAKEGLKAGKRRAGPNESDVLFVVESGFAPSWKSVTIPLPIPINKRLVITPLSFPLIKAENKGFVPGTLQVAGKSLPVETLVNMDTMARRLLKDQLPGIMLRTTVRAIAKSVAQDQAAKKGGTAAGVLVAVASVVTEQADERSWRTLPERTSVARAILPYGKQTLEFQTGKGVYRTEINIGNRFTVVPIRLTGGAVMVGEQNVISAMPVASERPTKSKAAAKNATKKPAAAN
jgi:hypothetical protein